MTISHFNIKGLSTIEVNASRKKHGQNSLEYKKTNPYIEAIVNVLKEPMVVLLLVASGIYFISGKTDDAIFLLLAVVLVSIITLYQDSRSRNALEKLKDFSMPKCKVIRDGKEQEIRSEEVVVGDILKLEEGSSIAADGIIIHSNDFSVNESILTGESLSVLKDRNTEDNKVFHGTTVATGLAIITVTEIGNRTKLGKIGKNIESIEEEKTPLELQIADFIKKLVIVGAIVFLLVWAINYFKTYNLLGSLLQALTLAMSILPEEIPMAFTTFMAIGAWRLMKKGIVVKQMKTVETLGSASIICTDKTGTLTENKMSLASLFALKSQRIIKPDETLNDFEKELITLSMWSSEPIPFDPMEIALHDAYESVHIEDKRPHFKLIHEYALGGKPPMMTHVFANDLGHKIIACKGAPEAIMAVSKLTNTEKDEIENAIKVFTSQGYRVLGVAEADFEGNVFPKTQQEISFNFKGIVAFYDPPKPNIELVLQRFYKAGILVKIITGDNKETTTSIAKQIGFQGYEKSISGDELMQLSESEFNKTVMETNIFYRMFPEAKLEIINSLKAQNQIVAMTGDGVNDGPALKAAHIGISMGKKGTEIAKDAASLILLRDDLSKIIVAISMGRRIYTNLKKAIQYIISIHIPIILTVFIPLALGWIYPNIFSPIHIIFLEIIMGPTCSIIFENEPIEKNTMLQKPRIMTSSFFNWKEIIISIIQGIAITIGTLSVYQYAVNQEFNESLTRAMVFLTIVTANVFLTLENRSFYNDILTTLKYKNNLIFLIIGITATTTTLLLSVQPFMDFFELGSLNSHQLGVSIFVGFISVIWFELVKWGKRMGKQ
jgi:P-type Ca2+ transporter type 2C